MPLTFMPMVQLPDALLNSAVTPMGLPVEFVYHVPMERATDCQVWPCPSCPTQLPDWQDYQAQEAVQMGVVPVLTQSLCELPAIPPVRLMPTEKLV